MSLRMFTVRRLMILTLLVAVGIEGMRMARLSMQYTAKADEHRREAARSQAELVAVRSADSVEYIGSNQKDFIESYFNDAFHYHDAMRAKYQYASIRPWAAVSEDPKAPDPLPSLSPLDEQPSFLTTGD